MMKSYDEIMAAALKRGHDPQRILGDILAAEIGEKQARSIKCQMTIAKLPLSKEVGGVRGRRGIGSGSGLGRCAGSAAQRGPDRRDRNRQDASRGRPGPQLEASIRDFIALHNEKETKPFNWTASPERLIAARQRGYQMTRANH